MTPASGIQTPLTPGEKLGPYEVAEQIGSGGQAIVYRAHDALLDRHVAVKQLLPPQDDAMFRQRFRSEVELQRKVSAAHSGIVQLVEGVENERGVFLIMEFVAGHSLESLLMKTGKAIDATQCLRFMWSTAKALQAIHDQGVLHRDLKPANLLVPTSADQSAKYPVKIADLGVATLVAEQEALPLGSVRYMAPELFQKQAVDARADVYSLGMIFYEMLIGRAAFQQAFKAVLRDERNQALRWMKWHTNARATAPPAHEMNPALPPQLSALVARAMAKDINDRLGSAAEFAAAIERHFTAEGVSGAIEHRVEDRKASHASLQPAMKTADVPKPARRKKLGLILGAVALLTVGGVLAVELNREDPDAVTEQRRLTMLDRADAILASTTEPSEEALAFYQDAADGLPEDDALAVRARIGIAWLALRRSTEAEDFTAARQALADLRALGADSASVDVARAEMNRKETFFTAMTEITAALNDRRVADAEDQLERFDALRLMLSEAESEQVTGLRVRLWSLAQRMRMERDLAEVDRMIQDGRWDDAFNRLRAMERVYTDPAVGRTLASYENLQRFNTHLAAADAALNQQDDVPGAITQLQRALTLRDDPEAAERLSRLQIEDAVARGRRLLAAGDPSGARQAFLQAIALGDEADAPRYLSQMDTQASAQALVDQGDAAARLRDFDSALSSYHAAQELAIMDGLDRRILDAEFGRAMDQGEAALQAGDLEAAERAYRRALQLQPQDRSALAGRDQVANAAGYRAALAQGDRAREASRFDEAMAAYRRALGLLDTAEVQQKLRDTEYQQWIAQAQTHMDAREWREAASCLRAAQRLHDGQAVRALLAEVAERTGGGGE